MPIIPAIDLIDGRVVRLLKGDYDKKSVYDADPVDQVRTFYEKGYHRIHVVDLDGAKAGAPHNLDVLRRMSAVAPDVAIEWGGGITSTEALQSVFDAGARHAIIGSIAAINPRLFAEWLDTFGPDRMVLGADVRDGRIAVSGWTAEMNLTIDALLDLFKPHGLKQAIVTDISRDGTLSGPSTPLYLDLSARHPQVAFTVSGGISSRRDIDALRLLGLNNIIVGKAYYEGKIEL